MGVSGLCFIEEVIATIKALPKDSTIDEIADAVSEIPNIRIEDTAAYKKLENECSALRIEKSWHDFPERMGM